MLTQGHEQCCERLPMAREMFRHDHSQKVCLHRKEYSAGLSFPWQGAQSAGGDGGEKFMAQPSRKGWTRAKWHTCRCLLCSVPPLPCLCPCLIVHRAISNLPQLCCCFPRKATWLLNTALHQVLQSVSRRWALESKYSHPPPQSTRALFGKKKNKNLRVNKSLASGNFASCSAVSLWQEDTLLVKAKEKIFATEEYPDLNPSAA